jgi:glutamate 5-kinase
MRRGRKRRGHEVVLVSSGAIALGVAHLGLGKRPSEMAALQAAAATGQSLLMRRYADAFAEHEIHVAQVLLTHADLAHRGRANNARAAVSKLLELGALPIINENDAVAVDEIRFGDNDALAAMVTPLCEAELLILLSDVDGLLDDRGTRVPHVARIDDAVRSWVTTKTSGVGTGGMHSKLDAVRTAAISGSHVVIAPARARGVVARVLEGEDLGTLFFAPTQRLRQRKHWIAYTLRPRGTAIVDNGAAAAIQSAGRSILCVGVLGVRGHFVVGDAISIASADGTEIARGLARLSATDAARLAGAPKPDGSELLVHRDDLVVLPA